MTITVGFVGLGRMGRPMALGLVRAGFEVIVRSRSRGPVEELVAAGAREAASGGDLAAGADVICTCLPDARTCEEVYLGADGLARQARPGQVLVEHSTIGPELARRAASAAARRGAGYLDAPVSGGVERAADASLTIMVGGAPEHLGAARPVLDAVGSRVHHMGPVGRGCIVKLTNQLLVGVHTIAACEAFLFGTGAGADPEQLLDVLATSWGASAMLTRNGPLIASGAYGSLAPVRLLLKDLGLVEEAAAELGIALPLARRTRALFEEAAARGLGEVDIAGLVTVLTHREADRPSHRQ